MKILRLFGALLIAFAAVVAGVGAYFADLFRDGLGPDAVASAGALAEQRFREGFVGPATWSVGLLVLGLCLVAASFAMRSKVGLAQPTVQRDGPASGGSAR